VGRGGAPRDSATTATGQPRCTATTQAGQPCQAFAPAGSTVCRVHDPAQAEAVQAARARGGAAAARLRVLQGRRSKLDTPAALVRFTATLLHDVLELHRPYELARVVLYGVSIQRQLLESSDLEQRLAALEAQLATGRGQRWHG
jgi:hypothetical protein